MFVKCKRNHPKAIVPTKAHKTDAGIDLYSCEETVIKPYTCKIVDTGLSIEIPEGYAGFVWGRSGLSRSGIHKYAGVIDSDYRGSIGVILYNSTSTDYKININDRIAQLVIQKVESIILVDSEALSETMRGTKGFGSSGK